MPIFLSCPIAIFKADFGAILLYNIFLILCSLRAGHLVKSVENKFGELDIAYFSDIIHIIVSGALCISESTVLCQPLPSREAA